MSPRIECFFTSDPFIAFAILEGIERNRPYVHDAGEAGKLVCTAITDTGDGIWRIDGYVRDEPPAWSHPVREKHLWFSPALDDAPHEFGSLRPPPPRPINSKSPGDHVMHSRTSWWHVPALLAEILKELKMTNSSVAALSEAVAALSQSVTTAVSTIHAELDKIAQASAAGDDPAVQAATAQIRNLASTLDQATTDAANALVPASPPTDGSAPQA